MVGDYRPSPNERTVTIRKEKERSCGLEGEGCGEALLKTAVVTDLATTKWWPL